MNHLTFPAATFLHPTKLPNGSFQVSLSNWTVLGTATEISAGQFRFADTQATHNSGRFYRVQSL